MSLENDLKSDGMAFKGVVANHKVGNLVSE